MSNIINLKQAPTSGYWSLPGNSKDNYLDSQLHATVSKLSANHSKQEAPLIARGCLHMILDFSGVFSGAGSHDGIKLSGSINRLSEAGLLIKTVKANGKVFVSLPIDGISKPYFQ
jgi:hypothetical protein